MKVYGMCTGHGRGAAAERVAGAGSRTLRHSPHRGRREVGHVGPASELPPRQVLYASP